MKSWSFFQKHGIDWRLSIGSFHIPLFSIWQKVAVRLLIVCLFVCLFVVVYLLGSSVELFPDCLQVELLVLCP